jgi:hypothetical protein
MTQEKSAQAEIWSRRKEERTTDPRLLLLKEYTAKFRRLGKEAENTWAQRGGLFSSGKLPKIHHCALANLLQKLRPPALDLARHVSQHIEHGDMDLLERLEFRLRLAEFEQAIQAAEALVNATRL